VVTPAGPVAGTLELSPGAVRRTAVLDMLWHDPKDPNATAADGAALQIVGSVRDRSPRGAVTAHCRAGVAPDNRLVRLATEPDGSALQVLIGAQVASGFRALAAQALPQDEQTTLRAVLDDLPVAALIARYAVQRTASLLAAPEQAAGLAMEARTIHRPELAQLILERMTNLCAGWQEGGIAVTAMRQSAEMPLQSCPAAPSLAGADPDGWQEVIPLPTFAMRRRRRLDVVPDGAGGARVHGMFRDTYGEPGRGEIVLHEYALTARVDAGARLHDVVAEPRVLPFEECPLAAASAGRLEGLPAAEAAAALHQNVLGSSGCTHLTDMLRGLGAVPYLLSDAAA